MEIDYRVENCLKCGYPYSVRNDAARRRCCMCGAAIYEGDDFYDFFGDIVCGECEFDYVLKNFHRYM